MKYLLDTHVWVWSQVEAEKIGPETLTELSDMNNQLFISSISTLEVARLVQIGILSFDDPLEKWIRLSLEALQCSIIEMSNRHAMDAYQLPETFHKDPADRILAATARIEDLTLVTADDVILGYSFIRTQDARK